MPYVLLFALLIFIVFCIPQWDYSKDWGYGPSGVLAVLLLVLIIFLVLGAV